jgi:hypothetical protein
MECKRCGYETSQKSNLLRHLERKVPCEPKLSDVSTESLISELNHKEYNEVTYSCVYCNREFNFNQSRHRHQLICKKKTESNNAAAKAAKAKEKKKVATKKAIKELQDKLELVMKELQEKKASGNVTINNNINAGTQVINKLRNFGNENMEAVPNHFIRSSVMNLEYATLFENLHCDPEYPENHNIRIKSKKDKELEMFTQDKWKIKSFKNGLSEVMDHLNRIYQDFCRHNFDDLIEDVGEEDAEATLKDLQEKTKITPDVHKEILNTLEEYRPMLTKAIGMVVTQEENLQLT